jgi:hypothetical protein
MKIKISCTVVADDGFISSSFDSTIKQLLMLPSSGI